MIVLSVGRSRTDTQVALQDRRCVPDQAQELDEQHNQLLVSLGRFVMIMTLLGRYQTGA